jgi:hypothetical protein
MSETLDRIRALVAQGEVRISDHGYDELEEDGILPSDVLAGIGAGITVEDYPDAARGPSVLVLQQDRHGEPIHAVWGIPRGLTGPAVLVTAYRPDPARWTADFMQRNEP